MVHTSHGVDDVLLYHVLCASAITGRRAEKEKNAHKILAWFYALFCMELGKKQITA